MNNFKLLHICIILYNIKQFRVGEIYVVKTQIVSMEVSSLSVRIGIIFVIGLGLGLLSLYMKKINK